MAGLTGLSALSGVSGMAGGGVAVAPWILFDQSSLAMGTAITTALGPDGFTWAQGKNPTVDQYGKIIAFCQSGGALAPLVSNDGGLTWIDPTRTNFQTGAGEVGVRCSLAYDSIHDKIHALFIWSNAADVAAYYRQFDIVRDGSNNITGITKNTAINCLLDRQRTIAAGDATNDPGVASQHPVMLWLNTDPVGRPHGMLIASWGINVDLGSAVGAANRISTIVLANSSADGNVANWRDLAGGSTIAATSPQKPFVAATEMHYRDPGDYRAWNAYPSVVRLPNGNIASICAFTGDGVYYREAQWNAGTGRWPTLSAVDVGPKFKRAGTTPAGYSLPHECVTDGHIDTINNRLWYGMIQWINDIDGDAWTFHYVDLATGEFNAADPVDVYSAGASHNGSTIFIVGDVHWVEPAAALLVTSTSLPSHLVSAWLFDSSGTQISGPLDFTGVTEPFDIPVIVPDPVVEGVDDYTYLIVGRGFNAAAANEPPTYSGGPYNGYALFVDVQRAA